MTDADRLVLDLLKPYMTDTGYALVKAKVGKAGSIGNLRDSVALAELEMAKRKFSSRSEAARYAAEVRWQSGRAQPYLSQRTNPRVFPSNAGGEIRAATINGETKEYHVSQVAAAEVKAGDMISTGYGSNPRRVKEVVRLGSDQKPTIVTETLDAKGGPTTTTTLAGTAKVYRWNIAGETTGKFDPTRRVDPAKIDTRSRRYIDEGKTAVDRVRRRNEVIDWYASQGVDVTPTITSRGRGGAQWLMPKG